MGVCLGGIPVSTTNRICDYFRCHIKNGTRAARIWKGHAGQEETKVVAVLLCFVLIRQSIGKEPQEPKTGYIENGLMRPCVKCHSGRLKAWVCLQPKMKSKNIAFCLLFWPGRETCSLHSVTWEEKPAQGHPNLAQSMGAGFSLF